MRSIHCKCTAPDTFSGNFGSYYCNTPFPTHPTVLLSYFYSCPALLALLLSAAPLAAQPTSPADEPAKPRQAVKLGVSSNETVGGSYERQWGRYSLQTTLGYWTYGYRSGGAVYVTDTAQYLVDPPYQARVHRLVLGGQLRRYLQPRKPALVGWYAAAGVQLLGHWARYRYDLEPTRRRFSHEQTLQLRFGRQCQLGPRFTFDFSLGPEVDLGVQRIYQLNPSTGRYARTGPRQFYAYGNASLALQIGYRL